MGSKDEAFEGQTVSKGPQREDRHNKLLDRLLGRTSE